MYLSKSEIWFLMVIFIIIVFTAIPIDGSFKSTYGNSKSRTDVKSKIVEEKNKSISSMMDFDIEKDSENKKQLQEILPRDKVMSLNYHQQKLRNLPRTKLLSRSRKSIIGKDDRNLVETSTKAQTYPFSTVVSLSSGCTGTLVSAQHVLTAAHCVHDGKRFLKQARKLRIGILKSSGIFRWMKVSRIHLPRLWKAANGKRRTQHDYALLKLRHPHSRPIMAIKPSALKRGSAMQFAGFHSDKKPNAMWLSQCRVVAAIQRSVFSFCDGVKGISGSGVYVHSGAANGDAIVGVVSAIRKGRFRGRRQLFNLVISFTPKTVRKIKRWMKKTKRKRKVNIRG